MKRAAPLIALVGLIVAAIVATAILTGDGGGTELTISEVVGAVTVTNGESEQSAKAGIALSADDRIVTGADGRAVLMLGPDTRIRLQQESTMQVTSVTDDEVKLELEGGLLEATVRPNSSAVRVGNSGRELLATDADLRFGVDDDGLAIEASRGTVAVAGVPGVAQLGPDERVTLSTGEEPVLRPIPDELLLDVDWPEPKVRGKTATITGVTEPGATVIVAIVGQPTVQATAAADGSFAAEISLGSGTNVVNVHTVSLFGEETERVKADIESDQGVEVHSIGATYNGSPPGGDK